MSQRRGFTLVELVVVIMILGILAAVAVPKLISTTGSATDNGLKQTLSVLRDAVDYYSSQNGGKLPGADGTEATFKADIAPYIRGGLVPKSPIGTKTDTVKVVTSAGAMTGDNSTGWSFNNKDGGLIANSSALSNDGATTYDKF